MLNRPVSTDRVGVLGGVFREVAGDLARSEGPVGVVGAVGVAYDPDVELLTGPHVDAHGTPADPYQLLGKWAHMLGFRAHFSTKSRRYSVTLGQLCRARAKYRDPVATAEHDEDARKALLDLEELEARLLADDTETTLVIGNWTNQAPAGPTPATKPSPTRPPPVREYAQWRAQTKNTNR